MVAGNFMITTSQMKSLVLLTKHDEISFRDIADMLQNDDILSKMTGN